MHIFDTSNSYTLYEQIDPILNPPIIVGGFEVRELVTTLTALLMTAVAWYAWGEFRKYRGPKYKEFDNYKRYFFFFGLCMIFAAIIGHFLQAYLSAEWKAIGWIVVSLSQLFLVLASVGQMRFKWSAPTVKTVKAAVILKFSVFLALVLLPMTRSFVVVQANSTIDMLGLVLPLQFLLYKNTRRDGGQYVLGAIGVSMVTAIFSFNRISISPWFNYHDICHVLMAISLYLMFIGTFRLSTDLNE